MLDLSALDNEFSGMTRGGCRRAMLEAAGDGYASFSGPPDEARDDHGQWTDGSEESDSPKVGELKRQIDEFHAAQKNRDGNIGGKAEEIGKRLRELSGKELQQVGRYVYKGDDLLKGMSKTKAADVLHDYFTSLAVSHHQVQFADEPDDGRGRLVTREADDASHS